MEDNKENSKTKLFKAVTVLAMLGAVLVGAMIITEVKGYRFIGGGVSATNTISVSGEGEVVAPPDIANVSFTVRESATKVSDAQDKVSVKTKSALSAVRKLGVSDKDIKTQNYSSYPKYEWQEGTVSCMAVGCPPSRPGKQVIIGYEVSQTVDVKVRDLEKVNTLVEELASAGVTEMYGPNFAIDNEDSLKAEARKIAIENARTKADVLARDLGVTLVRVVSFSEGGNYPIYTRSTMMSEKADFGVDSSTPEIPQGEEKIVSNVTVTYEIR